LGDNHCIYMSNQKNLRHLVLAKENL
jgi:hypothetical protein